MPVLHRHHEGYRPHTTRGHGDPLMAAAMKNKDQGDDHSQSADSMSTATPADPLFREVRHHNPRPVQILPNYPEFRLGHGDPMIKAVMKHWHDDMIPHSPRPPPEKPKRKGLLAPGSPLHSLTTYFTDVFRLEKITFQDRVDPPMFVPPMEVEKDTVVTFPRLPTEEDQHQAEPSSPITPNNVHLKQHGSPLCYYNDHVHIGHDDIVTFPCLPKRD